MKLLLVLILTILCVTADEIHLPQYLTFNAAQNFSRLGSAIASCDINADGIDDYILGAYAGGKNEAGEVFVVYGDAKLTGTLELATLTHVQGFKIFSNEAIGNAGYAVACGDLNNDGIADIMLSVNNGSSINNRTSGGKVYVVYGSRTRPRANIHLETMNNTAGFVIYGPESGAQIGNAMTVGDVNGDGVLDLLIGSPYASPNGVSWAGCVYIIYGAKRFNNIDLAKLDPSVGFAINGFYRYGKLGGAVAVGDVNDDLVNDILIGAHTASANGSNSGAGYVVYGIKSKTRANVETYSLPESVGYQIIGPNPEAYFGTSVAVGDINADGINDAVFGAIFGHDSELEVGSVSVVYGVRGTRDYLYMSNFTIDEGFTIRGCTMDWLGMSTAVADANNDGIDDVISGAPYAGRGGDSDHGEVFVIYGSRTSQRNDIFTYEIDITNGFEVIGYSKLGFTGWSVATGDIDGDGRAEILIGANWSSSDRHNRGGSVSVVKI